MEDTRNTNGTNQAELKWSMVLTKMIVATDANCQARGGKGYRVDGDPVLGVYGNQHIVSYIFLFFINALMSEKRLLRLKVSLH